MKGKGAREKKDLSRCDQQCVGVMPQNLKQNRSSKGKVVRKYGDEAEKGGARDAEVVVASLRLKFGGGN